MVGRHVRSQKRRARDSAQAALEPRLHELIEVLGRAVALRWRQDYAEMQRAEAESDAQDSTATR